MKWVIKWDNWISKAVEAEDKIKWKWQKELEQFAVVFWKPGTARILPFHPFVVLHLPNQKNERVLQPDFRIWKTDSQENSGRKTGWSSPIAV